MPTKLSWTWLVSLFLVACGPEALDAAPKLARKDALEATDVKLKLNRDLRPITRQVLPRLADPDEREPGLDNVTLLSMWSAELAGEEVRSGSLSAGDFKVWGPFKVRKGDQLDVKLFNDSGDADLYVREGAEPTTSSYDCRPYLDGKDETCHADGKGDFWVGVRGATAADYRVEIDTGGVSEVFETLLDGLTLCHSQHPLSVKLVDQSLDLPVGADSFTADVASNGVLEVSGELPDLNYHGTLRVSWPENDSILCSFSGISVDVPVEIDGAHFEGSAKLATQDGALSVSKLTITTFSVDDVEFDNQLLQSGFNASAALADLFASLLQEVIEQELENLEVGDTAVDPLELVLDFRTQNGFCGTPGSTANVTNCLSALIASCIAAETFPGCDGSDSPLKQLQGHLNEALAATSPSPIAVKGWANGVQYRLRATPTLSEVNTTPARDVVRLNVGLAITSPAPTAACAAGLTRSTAVGETGSFEPQADLDVVVPFSTVNDVLYEIARQGGACVDVPNLPFDARFEPRGPLTVSKRTSFTAPGAPTVSPTLRTSIDVGLVSDDASSTVTARLIIDWVPEVSCSQMLRLAPTSATLEALVGKVRKGPITYDVETDTPLRDKLLNQVQALPQRIGRVPVGVTTMNVPGLEDLYLVLARYELSTSELAFGLNLTEQRPSGCISIEFAGSVDEAGEPQGPTAFDSGGRPMDLADPFLYGAQGAGDFDALPDEPPAFQGLTP